MVAINVSSNALCISKPSKPMLPQTGFFWRFFDDRASHGPSLAGAGSFVGFADGAPIVERPELLGCITAAASVRLSEPCPRSGSAHRFLAELFSIVERSSGTAQFQ
jgi:hypothetical protein